MDFTFMRNSLLWLSFWFFGFFRGLAWLALDLSKTLFVVFLLLCVFLMVLLVDGFVFVLVLWINFFPHVTDDFAEFSNFFARIFGLNLLEVIHSELKEGSQGFVGWLWYFNWRDFSFFVCSGAHFGLDSMEELGWVGDKKCQ